MVPLYACMLPFQVSVSVRPSRPVTRSAIGTSVTWKPVPKMIVSTSRSLPSSATTERGRTSVRPPGHDLDVRLRQRRIPLVGRQDALAADAVVRRELLPQLRVLDLLAHVGHRDPLEQLPDGAVAELEDEGLARPVDPRAHRELGRREEAVERSLPALHRPVAMRDDPGRRALEHVQLGHLRLDLGDELDRGGAGADHGHALAGQVVVVVPLRRVEGLALEALEARDLWQ